MLAITLPRSQTILTLLTTPAKVRAIEIRVSTEQLRSLRARPDGAGKVEVDLGQVVGDGDALVVELGRIDADAWVALQRDFVGAELNGGVDAHVAVAGLADDIAVGGEAWRVLEVGAGVVGAHAVVVAVGVDFGLEGQLGWVRLGLVLGLWWCLVYVRAWRRQG